MARKCQVRSLGRLLRNPEMNRLNAEWAKKVAKEIKKTDLADLFWNTPEVPLTNPPHFSVLTLP